MNSFIAHTSRRSEPLADGGRLLPAVTVDSYNEELRDDDGLVSDRASCRAFRAILAAWRERLGQQGEDPFGDTPMEEMKDVQHEGVTTIGTGLGNTRFTNRTD